MKFYMNIREVKSRGCLGDLNIRQGGPMTHEKREYHSKFVRTFSVFFRTRENRRSSRIGKFSNEVIK